MKTCLLIAVSTFLMLSGTANAEWSKVATLPTPNPVDYYYDSSTIITARGRKYAWHLMDNAGFFGEQFGESVRFILSYSCGDYDAWVKLDARNRRNPEDRHQYKNLGYVAYSGRMGSGTILRDTTKDRDEDKEKDMSVGNAGPFVPAARAVSERVCK
jgi:hypothetical protein